jgi:signal transduction histidine kinase
MFVDFFVHDILDFTILNKDEKNFTKNITIFDIKLAVQQIIDILEDKTQMKNIKVKTRFIGFENLDVKTDMKRLQQILLNLFSNAVKFTDRNGKINILVEVLKKDDKNHVQISVQDNGRGIKQEDHGRLFQLFGSIKDMKKQINTNGIGLGLVICKMIVEKFNGSIYF